MFKHRRVVFSILHFACLACPAQGDWFGVGENRFEIPMVTIGSPGNASDTTGTPTPAGHVDYTYRIAQFEIPEEAIRKANDASDIAGEPLGITLDERGPQKPATSVTWFEAARFVNWLNKEVGATPAYKFNDQGDFLLWTVADSGYNPVNPLRNAYAAYFLPSVDEWYKAAFYDPVAEIYWDYPTGSNDEPTPVSSGSDPGTAVWNQTTGRADVQLAGGQSPYGTVAQGGNVNEWNEGSFEGVLDTSPNLEVRARRGGTSGPAINGSGLSSLAGGDRLATFDGPTTGFRVASVPEPSCVALLFIGCLPAAMPQRTART